MRSRFGIITPLFIVLSLLPGMTASLQGQSVLARAEVNPSAVMVGESAVYSIRFLNASSVPDLNTPRVDGLDFNPTPSTRNLRQFINGRMSSEIELSWTFRPVREGTFVIPGRTVRIGGQDIEISAVELRAVPLSEEARSRALLRLEIPEPPYYVGQALPARLSLLVRRDLDLTNVAFPESTGDSFLHSEFDKNPARGTVRLQGRLYNVLSWEILITPIKSGTAELRFSQEIGIQVPSPDDPFQGLFSMSRRRSESYQVFTDPISTNVLPLPEEGRPERYGDAIGSFEAEASLAGTDLQVGEPVTFVITLTGKGNFERIAPPEIPEWENWRVYPPKVAFSPSDAIGFEGAKSFEYILIPQSADITEIPEFSYSTFDPEAGTYRTTSFGPIPVQVKPSDKPLDSGLFLPESEGRDGLEQPAVPRRILPLRTKPGTLIPAGSVLWQNPRFWIVNLLSGLLLLLCARGLHYRRRLEDDEALARRLSGNRKIRKALQQAGAAAASGNGAAFLEAARFALQERIAHLSSRNPEAKTLVTSDCLNILSERNVPDSLKSRIDELLNAADACQFAGALPAKSELAAMHKELINAISELSRLPIS